MYKLVPNLVKSPRAVFLYKILQDGYQAIHIATRRGHIQLVEYLLDEEEVSPRAQVKVSAFHGIVQVIWNEAQLHIQDVGELIHLALGKNQLEIVSKLIEKYNVDPTAPLQVISWLYTLACK